MGTSGLGAWLRGMGGVLQGVWGFSAESLAICSLHLVRGLKRILLSGDTSE